MRVRPLETAPPLRLGRYPTPLQRLETLSTATHELWVKRDDLTDVGYGGNKVRKLGPILSAALAAGARRLVTVGAAGSHHVLATTYFGRQVNLPVEAVLVPQPRTAHALEVLRAGLGAGLRAFPVFSWAAAPWAVASRMAAGSTFVTLGGSNVTGTMGYVDAASELASQVRSGEMPEPDVCIVALGSGGTAAGLAAGFAAANLKTHVVGVCVSQPVLAVRLAVWRLAFACSRRSGTSGLATCRRITVDTRFLGAGYGHATPESDDALRVGQALGLTLDPTYTAKAFAAALAEVRTRTSEKPRGHVVLYWHTLSSAPMDALLRDAPLKEALPAWVERLLPGA